MTRLRLVSAAIAALAVAAATSAAAPGARAVVGDAFQFLPVLAAEARAFLGRA